MNLSTSSSDPATARAQRGIYFRMLVTILIGMGIALVLVRAFALYHDASSSTILGRVLEAQQALPRILDEESELAIFFGSSMVEVGFSPRQFDREMQQMGVPLKSFNFGFGGLNPYYQEILSRRLVDAFESRDRKLKLAMVEFNPFQATRTRRDGARALEDSFAGLLGSPRELLDILLEDPTRGVRVYTIRYLRDGVSAEMATNFFGEMFQAPPRETDIPPDEEISRRRDELAQELGKRFEQDYPDYVSSQWSYEWQGGGTIPEERPAESVALVNEYYSTLLTEHRLDADRLWRIQSADIINLEIDEELIDAFIAIVKNLQRIAEHVEVILLPKNHDWIVNPPAAMARQRAALARIEQETGVVVRDWQALSTVTPDMYSDTTHLARYTGAVAFTHQLAQHYGQMIGP